MKILVVSAIILMLVGCASASEVLKLGPDTSPLLERLVLNVVVRRGQKMQL
jgi:uncharacterized lipoprotein YajG